MKVLTHRFSYRIGDSITLIPLSDVHIGNALASTKHLKAVIDRYSHDPSVWFASVGDLFDGIIVGDKRFKQSMTKHKTDAPLDEAVDEAVAILRPVADRILWMNDGNHELSVLDRYGIDLTGRVLWGLFGGRKDGAATIEGIRLGYAGFVRLIFEREHSSTRQMLTIYSCHGVGGASRTEGGALTSIGNVAKSYRADLSLWGHNHKLEDWDNIVIEPDARGREIISRREIRVNTGTFLRGYSDGATTSYSEKAQYKPNQLGYYTVSIGLGKQTLDIDCTKRVIL